MRKEAYVFAVVGNGSTLTPLLTITGKVCTCQIQQKDKQRGNLCGQYQYRRKQLRPDLLCLFLFGVMCVQYPGWLELLGCQTLPLSFTATHLTRSVLIYSTVQYSQTHILTVLCIDAVEESTITLLANYEKFCSYCMDAVSDLRKEQLPHILIVKICAFPHIMKGNLSMYVILHPSLSKKFSH